MRILFAFPQSAFLRDYEKAYLPMVCEELRQHGASSDFVLEDNPGRADLIILLQSAQYKTAEYVHVLENDPLVRDHAERVFVIDYDDHPEGMLAGLYTSIEPPFFRPELHRSWPILFMNNPFVYNLGREQISRVNPKRLFSFVGAPSHEVRKRLLNLFSTPSSEYHVELTTKWYNHNDGDRSRFIALTLDSLFCLCPRGYAAYTNRIPEVMAMGRVPVVIADNWVPFSFLEVTPYYVRVAEKDIGRLPEILSGLRTEAGQMGRCARHLWEKYCSPNRRVVAAVECITQLARQTECQPTFAQYKETWHSPTFRKKCGWTLRQRIALRLQQHLRRLVVRTR